MHNCQQQCIQKTKKLWIKACEIFIYIFTYYQHPPLLFGKKNRVIIQQIIKKRKIDVQIKIQVNNTLVEDFKNKRILIKYSFHGMCVRTYRWYTVYYSLFAVVLLNDHTRTCVCTYIWLK